LGPVFSLWGYIFRCTGLGDHPRDHYRRDQNAAIYKTRRHPATASRHCRVGPALPNAKRPCQQQLGSGKHCSKWSVIGSRHILTFIQQILCSANVQHRCHSHRCVASGSAVIYQERQATNQRRAVIVHDTPEDLMLNTARMHDASHFSHHRIPIDITTLNFDLAIMNGVKREVDSHKRANVSGRGLLGRGRGSNRGGSTSRNALAFS
jgi:hypothetical protein